MVRKQADNWHLTTFLFLACQTISMFGSMVVSYAITWELTLKTSSGLVMMISVLCTCLPQTIISLFAGVWADRYNRKTMIIISDTFIAIATMILAMFLFYGIEPLWMIYCVLCIRSIGQGIQSPAVMAVLPQIVPKDKLVRVNGINSTLMSITSLIAPAVGGLILSMMGFQWSLLVDVTTATIAVVIMLTLTIKRQPPIDSKLTILQDLKVGISYVHHHKVILTELIFFGLFMIFMSPAIFLTPLLVERTFGSDVWLLTANELAWAIGTLGGGVFVSIWGGWKNRFTTMALGSIWFGITFGLMGVASNIVFYLTLMLVAGLVMPLVGTAATVLIQERVEESYLGRVFSLWSIISNTVAPLGMMVFGPLADKIRIQWIMIFCGILQIILGMMLFSKRSIASNK